MFEELETWKSTFVCLMYIDMFMYFVYMIYYVHTHEL